jgi:myo-inositol 2-dehydrogenase / D-chiro-inositol 1-dehydrogenase
VDNVRIALIGCGGMGKGLVGSLPNIPDSELVAVADVVEEAAKAAGEQFNVPFYTDAAAVLAREDVDAVVIAPPNYLHPPMVKQAAAAKKHIFCEKPMALHAADARDMIRACQDNGVKLMIGQVLRYMIPFIWIEELVKSGELGDPVGIQVTRMGGGWGGGYRARWRLEKEKCGGPLFEIDAHEIDWMRRIMGEVDSVYGAMGNFVQKELDYEDLAYVVMNFKNGGKGCLLGGHAAFMGSYDGKLYGTKGSLYFDHNQGHVRYQIGDGEGFTIPYGELGDYEPGVQREVREFVEAVREDKPVTIPGEEGLANTEIAEAAQISAAENRVIQLPL